jgi:hypothetical protein
MIAVEPPVTAIGGYQFDLQYDTPFAPSEEKCLLRSADVLRRRTP